MISALHSQNDGLGMRLADGGTKVVAAGGKNKVLKHGAHNPFSFASEVSR